MFPLKTLNFFHMLLLKKRDEVTTNPSMDMELEGNETLVMAGSLKALKSIAPKLKSLHETVGSLVSLVTESPAGASVGLLKPARRSFCQEALPA